MVTHDIGSERLRHALPDEKEGRDDADRQQHVERDPGQINPEIANRLCRAAGEAAHERDRHGDAGRAGEERLHRDPHHLREIAEGRFATVGLPACVRRKADRCVERQIRGDGIELLRVERQQVLQALQRVDHHDAEEMEPQQRHRVADPALLLGRIDTGKAVDPAFEDRKLALYLALSLDNVRDVPAQRLHGCGDQCREYGDLQPSLPGHGTLSEEGLRRAARRAQAST